MRRAALLLLLLGPLFFLASCRKVPDHAKYIPKNALSVVGINAGSITKKIAWPALLGKDVTSSFDSFVMRQGYNVRAEDLRESGIDMGSTMYVCFTASGSPMANNYKPETFAILPVENSGKWTAFLQKAFPRMQPITTNSGKAAQLDSNLVILWTDQVAFLTAPNRTAGSYVMMPDSTEEWQAGTPDLPATVARLEALPKLSKEEALLKDDRFSLLAKSNRDLIAWVNYEQMMNGMGGMASAMSLMSSKLYKNMALSTTVDFKEGEAEAEMWYYMSDELKDVGRKMAGSAPPKELIARLPKEGLDGFGAFSFSTKSFKVMLEKMGMLGLINMGLTGQGLSIDDLVEAIPGNMVFAVNNYKNMGISPLDSQYARYPASVPKMDFTFAMKLGKKEKVAKLMQFLLARKLVEQVSPNVYISYGNPEGGFLVMDDKYAVAARTRQQAQDFLAGTAPRELPTDAQAAVGTGPLAMFVDFQQIFKGIDTAQMQQPRDRQMWLEAQRVFSYLILNDGSFSGDHFIYKARLHLLSQQENALLQLLRFSNRLTQIDRDYPYVTLQQPAYYPDTTLPAPNPVF